jgi:O-antigen/teichoic acid export membrane protein
LLAGNTFWSLFGLTFPMLIAVFCLPVLKRGLGTDRLGVLSLAWVVIGYFGLFDFGLSRALTKLVAEKLGQKRFTEIQPLISTSLIMLAGLGIVGTLATVLVSPVLVERLLKIPPALQQESLHSFFWLSASIPVVIVTAGARGVLEALQAFRLATAIRIPMGIFTYLGPVLVLPFSHSLVPVVAVLAVGRALACLAHLWACAALIPELKSWPTVERAFLKPLLSFGGWLTVSNVVGPFMVTFDRFVIGAMITVTAVAYYAVPFEVVFRLTMGPAALIAVLFPALSTAGVSDRGRLAFLYECGVKYIFIGLFPITLAMIALAPEGLTLWLGKDFAVNSATVARWLLVAIFINGVAQVPFAHLQAEGRPDLTAKLHLIELPFYAALLFLVALKFGIVGVAVAWCVRVVADTLLLFWFSRRSLPERRIVPTKLPWMFGGALAAFAVAASRTSVEFRGVFVLLTCLAGAAATWLWMISPRERSAFKSMLRRSSTAGVN